MHNNSPDPRTIHWCTLFALHISYWFARSYDQETARNHMGGCEDYPIPPLYKSGGAKKSRRKTPKIRHKPATALNDLRWRLTHTQDQ